MRRIRYRTRTLGRVIAPGPIPITYDSPLHSPGKRSVTWRVLSKVERTGSETRTSKEGSGRDRIANRRHYLNIQTVHPYDGYQLMFSRFPKTSQGSGYTSCGYSKGVGLWGKWRTLVEISDQHAVDTTLW